MQVRGSFLILMFLCNSWLSGQVLPSDFEQATFLEFTSQNDLYQLALKADKDFTNGLTLRLGHASMGNWGSKYLDFWSVGVSEYALQLSQEMYTPEDIRNPEVDSSDRPYSGLLYLTFQSNNTNWIRGERVQSELQVGLQGPIAGAKQTQNWLHANTNNWLVAGWDNQIGNGLILDYRLTYQRLLSKRTTYFESSYSGTINVGTLRNFAHVGLHNRLGFFNTSFANFGGVQNRTQNSDIERVVESARGTRKVFLNRTWQAYLIGDIGLTLIAYDGTVQGSLVPFESSVYRLTAEQLRHFSGITRIGFSLAYGRTQLTYAWVVTGYQIQYSDLIGWGEFRLVVGL